MSRSGKKLVVEPEPDGDRYELIVRGGKIVTPDGIVEADLGVRLGRITRIAPNIAENIANELDAEGAYVFPGIIDAHVHFNEPGRTDWEGISSGSTALAAGGGTCFFDMPLNSEPPVTDASTLRAKRVLAEEKSCVDFALWGGLIPENLDHLAGLRDAGAIGFKAFMSASGIESFPRVDPDALYEGMKRAEKLGMLVAVHAEDETLAARFAAEQKKAGRTDARGYLASRPVEVELAAIRQALEFAGETRCALHIVHVSSPEGVSLVAAAREQGVDVTAETCPHYLLLNEKDVFEIGAAAKCAPPLRDEARRKKLWEKLRRGEIQTVGSDHSPAPPEMKLSRDFFAIWGGIAGCQHGFELLFSAVEKTADEDLPKLSALLARNVARRFRLPRKGLLAPGYDADFSLFRFEKKRTIEPDELWTRHRISPYIGKKSAARMMHTYVRGQSAWSHPYPATPRSKGIFLRPEK